MKHMTYVYDPAMTINHGRYTISAGPDTGAPAGMVRITFADADGNGKFIELDHATFQRFAMDAARVVAALHEAASSTNIVVAA